jgi:hypothetical protein
MSKKSFSPVRFDCNETIGQHFEHWSGAVTRLINHGSHYEIFIESRSGFVFIVGKYISGGFISIPAFNVGADLANYDDYFWNKERLASIMNRVDAITVAEALRSLKAKNFI